MPQEANLREESKSNGSGRVVNGKLVVLMATHNTEKYVADALKSVEEVCGKSGREYKLFVADDASTDSTFRIVDSHKSMASVFERKTFPKADNVGHAKNRAVEMAVQHIKPEDWVLFLDDDDMMLDGRLELVEAAERMGLKAAAGDFEHLDNITGSQFRVNNSEAVSRSEFSPGTTVVSGALIPKSARYFYEVPDTCLEDYCTHELMRRNGLEWKHINTTSAVLVHRVRPDSFSRNHNKNLWLLNNSKEHVNELSRSTFLSSRTSTVRYNACDKMKATNRRLRLGFIFHALSGGGVERWAGALVESIKSHYDIVGIACEHACGNRALDMICGVSPSLGQEACVQLAKQCDILITWNPTYLHRYKYESNAKIVLTNHSGNLPWQSRMYSNMPWELCDAIHSVSREGLLVMPTRVRDRVAIIENSVSETSIAPTESNFDTISKLGINPDVKTVSFVGRLSEEKRWLRCKIGRAHV